MTKTKHLLTNKLAGDFNQSISEQPESGTGQEKNRLAAINQCFLKFDVNPDLNIKLLTDLCGELLAGDYAFYSRLNQNMLHSLGSWHAPPNFNHIEKPDGHICYDVIKQGSNEIFFSPMFSHPTISRQTPMCIC